MKRTLQMKNGNVTGAGKTFKGQVPVVPKVIKPNNKRTSGRGFFNYGAPSITPFLSLLMHRASVGIGRRISVMRGK